MSSEPLSDSIWLQQLQAGDHAAAEGIWQRYCKRLVGLARRMTRGPPSRIQDEEEVALTAFDSFCRRGHRRPVVYSSLPSRPACPPERDHPSRHQAVERARYSVRRHGRFPR